MDAEDMLLVATTYNEDLDAEKIFLCVSAFNSERTDIPFFHVEVTGTSTNFTKVEITKIPCDRTCMASPRRGRSIKLSGEIEKAIKATTNYLAAIA